jgi:hypothetical protein
MGGSSKSQTTGYKYFVGIHMVLCAGPIDFIIRILVDNDLLWLGKQGQGTIPLDMPNLFGGTTREGGITGNVDVCLGATTQTQNLYLVSQLGALLPAFRGVCALVLNQLYLGLNPYLKPWSVRASRIHVRQNGIPQWYDAKSEIDSGISASSFGNWSYLVVPNTDTIDRSATDFDSSDWQIGVMPFGNNGPGGNYVNNPITDAGFPLLEETNWPTNTSLWLRQTFTNITNDIPLSIKIGCDNTVSFWFNGVQYLNNIGGVGSIDSTNVNVITIPASAINNTTNYIALRCQDDGDLSYAALTIEGLPQYDMNPAHIIREALTDPDWGMGYAETDIDDVSFTAAADTLYAENLGCSKLWTDESTIEDFIKEICQLTNASVYVDRTTGLFVLKLIRNDYVVSDLITLGPSNIDNVTDFVQAKFGSLINQVIVQYWDAGANQTGTTTAQDLALIAEEGTTISQTNTYDGCTSITLASQLAQRDLQTLSAPLISCSIETNLASGAGVLNIGSVFIWNWPDYKVSGVVMRVTGIGYGDSKNNAILIKCFQDVFFELPPALVSNSGTKWSNPSGVALPVTQRLTFETPYLDIVQTVGQSTIDPILAANPEVSYVAVAGGKPTTGGISATFYDNIGAGFVEVATMQFCSVSALSVAVDPIIQTFVLTKTDNQFNEVVSGSWFQIDEEICVFQSIASDGVTISVLRGCLDTTPTAHVANSIVLFWDNYSTYDDTQLVASDVVETALCTVNGNAVLALAAAPVDTLTIVGRPAMPYPPGNVTVQATAFPSYLSPDGGPITLAWSHRDRTQQTTGLIVGYTEGNIGPETGVTYSTFIYGESGTLLHTETGLTTPNDSYSTELADSGLTIENSGGTSRYNNLLTIKIVSIRAGISCYQPYNWQVRRVGYGYSYGFYYGGLG